MHEHREMEKCLIGGFEGWSFVERVVECAGTLSELGLWAKLQWTMKAKPHKMVKLSYQNIAQMLLDKP